MSVRTTADDVVEQATKEVLEALTLIRSARNRIEQITVDQCWGHENYPTAFELAELFYPAVTATGRIAARLEKP